MTLPALALSCGRCMAATSKDEQDHFGCWWCQDVLCAGCWDAHGHCGHPEAEEMNRVARLVPQPLGRP